MKLISTEHVQSVSQVRDEDWNRLTDNGGYASLTWLQAVESYSVNAFHPQYLLAYAENKLVGAAILELVGDPDRENGVARCLFGGNRRLRRLLARRLTPNLAAGSPYGYGGQLLLARMAEIDQQTAVASELIAAAEKLGASLGAPLYWSGVLASDTFLLATLRQAGYVSARYLPVAELAIEWLTFDDYVKSLRSVSKNVGYTIRKQRNRCRTAGVIFEEPAEVSGLDEALVAMANQTYRRYGSQRFPFKPGFFTALHKELGDQYQICTARKEDSVLGFTAMLSDGHTAWADSYGLDYRHPDGKYVYFNLLYRWLIEKAIESGLKKIVFGRGLYELKIRRGCSLTDSYILAKPSNGITRLLGSSYFRLVDYHYSSQVAKEMSG